MIRVQTEDFDVGAELDSLRKASSGIGALASFVGVVRDLNDDHDIVEMTLEHYPEMTEAALGRIVDEAVRRWQLSAVRVIHRVGTLRPGDQIVLVAVGSSHRQAAFAGCEFIMDYLKTEAPFWKKEATSSGSRWVNSRASDTAAAGRWKPGAGG